MLSKPVVRVRSDSGCDGLGGAHASIWSGALCSAAAAFRFGGHASAPFDVARGGHGRCSVRVGHVQFGFGGEPRDVVAASVVGEPD